MAGAERDYGRGSSLAVAVKILFVLVLSLALAALCGFYLCFAQIAELRTRLEETPAVPDDTDDIYLRRRTRRRRDGMGMDMDTTGSYLWIPAYSRIPESGSHVCYLRDVTEAVDCSFLDKDRSCTVENLADQGWLKSLSHIQYLPPNTSRPRLAEAPVTHSEPSPEHQPTKNLPSNTNRPRLAEAPVTHSEPSPEHQPTKVSNTFDLLPNSNQ
ncbi:hypothetical protein Bbelb_156130 [Branchiostoma belcheri]|nr:hypothetical protein Bbelb_156130 [Branchiostoma belcheri]